MATRYTKPTISGFNANPPSDDGQQVPSNEITWAKHLSKLANPLKTHIDAVNQSVADILNDVPNPLIPFKDSLDEIAVGTTADVTTEMAALASSGKRVYLRDGTYNITGNVSLAEGTEICGSRNAIIQVTTDDVAAFTATDLSYFAIRGITLKGAAASPGDAAFAGVEILRCSGGDVEFCRFEDWMGDGVRCLGTAAGVCTNVNIRYNLFVKGDVSGTTTGYGVQDNSPTKVYEYCNNISIIGNVATGEWYAGPFVQNRTTGGDSHIYGMKVHDNDCSGMTNYGIVAYSNAVLSISSIADNGSGLFRITTSTAHGYSTGKRIHVQGSGDANGVWTITVIDTTKFDLDGSTHSASTTNGSVRSSHEAAGTYIGNRMTDIDGSRDSGGVGVKPFGSGFYCQAVGGILAIGNVFDRTNLQTTAESLTPGSIGINGITGDVQFIGCRVTRSGYFGINVEGADYYGNVTISDCHVQDSAQSEFEAVNVRNLTVSNLSVAHEGSSNGRVIFNTCENLVVDGIKYPRANGVSQLLDVDDCTNFSFTGCVLKNLAGSGVTVETAVFTGCDDGVIQGNNFDGAASAWYALTIDGCTDTIVTGNRSRMTADVNARATVRMVNTCTGTVYGLDNYDHGGRMENASTGGLMYTRGTTNTSGGKTRQQGDAILHTDPTTGSQGWWHKITASSGANDWESAAIS